MEAEHGVKMGEMEYRFLEDMRGPRKMFCKDFIDNQWQRTRMREMQHQERMMRLKRGRSKMQKKLGLLIGMMFSFLQMKQATALRKVKIMTVMKHQAHEKDGSLSIKNKWVKKMTHFL